MHRANKQLRISPWSRESYPGHNIPVLDVKNRHLIPRPPARSDSQSIRGRGISPRKQLAPLPVDPPSFQELGQIQRPRAAPVSSDFDRRGTVLLTSLGSQNNHINANEKLADYEEIVKNPPETTSFDTDARNIDFLNSILSIMPSNLQSVPESMSSKTEFGVPIAMQFQESDEVPSLIAKARVSPRSSRIYTRTETKALEKVLNDLMSQSRRAVQKMKTALATQAINGFRVGEASPSFSRRQSTARAKTIGQNNVPTHTRHSVSQQQSSSGGDKNKSFVNRPRSAASMTILETALAVAQESKAWDIVFAECVRQVHSKCKERGNLLNAIRVRNKQTCELLTNVVEAQQQMLNTFQKRQQHLRPRTRTVERKYRRKKAEMEVNQLTERIRAHQVKLDHARARIKQLGTQVGLGIDAGKAFDEELAEMNAEREYENSKIAFSALLEDLENIEDESKRFRNMVNDSLTSVEGIDPNVHGSTERNGKNSKESGSAVREALEMHRDFVMDKQKRKENLEKMATKVQAAFRATVARQTVIAQAKLAYQQRKLLEEAKRKEEERDAARLKVAKWLQRLSHIWLFRDRLKGYIGEEREKLKQEILKRRKELRTNKIDRASLTWRDYLNAAMTIQRSIRRLLWSDPQWRRKCMKKLKEVAQKELLGGYSDKEQAARVRRTIALSLQEQEQVFFGRIEKLRDRTAYLERKVEKAENLSQAHAENAKRKVAKANEEARSLVQRTKDECDEKVRVMKHNFHKLQHKLERTKAEVVDRAKRRSVQLESQKKDAEDFIHGQDKSGYKYKLDLLMQTIEMLSKLKIPDLNTAMGSINDVASKAEAFTHGHEDTGHDIAEEDKRGLSEIASQSAECISKTNLYVLQFQARLKNALEELTKRCEDIHDVFLDTDHERKVLVKRIVDLEKELASYHPSHPDHYEETTHHTYDSNSSPRRNEGKSEGAPHLPTPPFTKSIAKHVRRHSTIGILSSTMTNKMKKLSSLRRRPSVVRAHKSMGIL